MAISWRWSRSGSRAAGSGVLPPVAHGVEHLRPGDLPDAGDAAGVDLQRGPGVVEGMVGAPAELGVSERLMYASPNAGSAARR